MTRKVKLNMTTEAKEFLIKKGFDAAYGARQMRRTVERYLEDQLADAIIRGTFGDAEVVDAVVENDRIEFRVI